ncbi:hypothetical protein RRG08_055041 [Elysia crispata]|uniref:Uncharacterized protein n=1 Tax=Elysia crispata TaxID=231223 RepID=A0AAE1E7N2_9GAST|nr:hypothetical protein RRG08_055041 [Elysia crispata]
MVSARDARAPTVVANQTPTGLKVTYTHDQTSRSNARVGPQIPQTAQRAKNMRSLGKLTKPTSGEGGEKGYVAKVKKRSHSAEAPNSRRQCTATDDRGVVHGQPEANHSSSSLIDRRRRTYSLTLSAPRQTGIRFNVKCVDFPGISGAHGGDKQYRFRFAGRVGLRSLRQVCVKNTLRSSGIRSLRQVCVKNTLRSSGIRSLRQVWEEHLKVEWTSES